jgi:hypothetical protein
MQNLGIEIVTKRRVRYGSTYSTISTTDGVGFVKCELDALSNEFEIAGFQVDRPRQGIGKALLRQAEEEARSLQAHKITATIVSANCLASMVEVFGAEHIQVDKIGEYGKYGTSAWLDYPLQA